MDISIFTDKNMIPDDNNLVEALGDSYVLWQSIKDYVYLKYPNASEEWKHPGAKHGWSFRIKDKKRVIIYLLPRDKFFMVAFSFGQRATDAIIESTVSLQIIKELQAARVYAEGRGIRIEVKNDLIITDIKELIDIKIEN